MKNKILIVNTHIPWGGLGTYTVNIAKGFKEKGYDVYGMITHSDDMRYADFYENTINTINLCDNNKYLRYYNVINNINKINPDYIIINYNAVAHYILKYVKKRKIISVIHNDLPDFYRIAKINYEKIDAWIAPTPRIKKGFIEFTKNHKLNDKVHIIEHGVSICENKIELKKDDDAFNICFVGALFKHKGVHLIPDIFEACHKVCPNSRLTIIGDGEEKRYLVSEFNKRNISKYVNIKGLLTQEETRKELKKMNALLFPTQVEAFGLVIVESMMEGVIPVVSRIRGITDVIINNEVNGFLIENNNINEFSEKLISIGKNKMMSNIMSEKAKKYAIDKYSIERMMKEYVELINKID
jgi:glycosyltransferase involved in cell wall biosynthesis